MNCGWAFRFRRAPSALAALVLLIVIPAAAQPTVAQGDLVIAGTCSGSYAGPVPCFGFIDVRHAGGARKFSLQLPDMELMNILSGAYALYLTGSSTRLYTPSFGEIFRVPVDYSQQMDLAADASGNVFVLGGHGSIQRFPADATFPIDSLPVLPVPTGHYLLSGDLGTDQCTLYYFLLRLSFPSIVKRHDICRNVTLPDIPINFPPSCHGAVRVARDGSVVISACSSVYHFKDADTREYTLPAGHVSAALALDPDGTAFWSLSSTGLIEVDFTTGTATLRGPEPVLPFFGGMAFYGTPRSAVLAAADIPAQTPFGLLFFAVGVMAIALIRIARS
jgi:hypothetical protein